MVHQHGLRHLDRRQRHHFVQEEEDEVETVVITMPNPFTGRVQITQKEESKTKAAEVTKTLNEPMVRPKPTDDDDDDDKKDNKKATSTPTPTPSSKASSRPTHITSHSTSQSPSSLVIDTSATPAPRVLSTSAAGTVVAAISSAAASATSSPEPAAGGMSGGAKAGLALGILVAVGALLGAILFVAHRKKKQRAEQQMDNEKASMHDLPPPPIAKEPTPSIRTQATAPRLSLRPVTQFDPSFEKRKSAGNMLDVAAAGAGAAAAGNRSPVSPDAPSSPWEKRGAVNAGAPVNPFNDPQPRSVSPVSPVQDPFSNNAAIEPQAAPAGPPLNFNDTPAPNVDFGNPAPAIAAAEMAPAAAILAAPPTINGEQIPPSPAWTEDIPASPGPAPSGPLPVAAVGGAAPPPSNVHRVQLDFKPSMGDELELQAGQLVRMLHEYDDGWALCVRLDRSQQGVAPRTCLSKHPVKPRQGPPRQQGPPGQPRMRGPPGPGPNGPPRGPHGAHQQRPMSPASGRNSPHPPSLSPANGRMSPAPRSMSPGPRQMSPPQVRARSNSNAPYAGQPRSMSPGPYGGGPQMAPPQQMGRPRSNSASQAGVRRGPPPGPSPMNPNAPVQMPARKPIPGQAM